MVTIMTPEPIYGCEYRRNKSKPYFRFVSVCFSINEKHFSQIGIMIMDVISKDYVPLSLYGITIFIDLDGVTARYLKQLHPRIVMNIVHAWQGCYPARLQSINYINAPMYVHIGISIFKHFMNEKLKQRLHVYTPNETKMHKCFEDIPADIRPLEYGGTDSTAQKIAGNYNNYK